ncbi:MAG: septum formation protein Maf [Bacteroidetes bacterium]|jgi:septum formation protein|nr:septum formation protein Maf [Bacteroidota bacterium]
MKVILASASPRRAQLLTQVGIHFEIDPSSIEETFSEDTPPHEVVQLLARHKAEDVANRHPKQFLIAADTVVCLHNEILGKPNDIDQASEFLQKLSGQTHDVLSGVYAGETDSSGKFRSEISFFERTKVTFSSLTDLEIEQYIKYGQPFDKAGSYGIQDDLGSLFVEKINGDYYNVVGFPLHRFYDMMKTEMPDIHKKLFFQTS